jgi:hypothetical protein
MVKLYLNIKNVNIVEILDFFPLFVAAFGHNCPEVSQILYHTRDNSFGIGWFIFHEDF